MRILARSVSLAVLAALVALVPFGAFAAPSAAKPTFVKLVLSKKFMHDSSSMHATGTATLHWTKGDVSIKLTTAHLPSPSKFGKRVFVLFATDGGMTDKVGVLTAHGAMSGTSGMVMMNKIQDLYLYAEGSSSVKKPGNGVLVMSAMVG